MLHCDDTCIDSISFPMMTMEEGPWERAKCIHFGHRMAAKE